VDGVRNILISFNLLSIDGKINKIYIRAIQKLKQTNGNLVNSWFMNSFTEKNI